MEAWARETAADMGSIRADYERAIELVQGIHQRHERAIEREDKLVKHCSLPLNRVSGDFCVIAEHPENGWFCLFADSAGHGLASAIFSLQTPMLFRESVLLGMSLADVYERINQFLIRQRIADYFVCGTLVRAHGHVLEVINAGMPDALLLSAEEGLISRFSSQNLAFGIELGSGIQTQEYRLRRDSKASLLLYSDGLPELKIAGHSPMGNIGIQSQALQQPAAAYERLRALAEANKAHSHDDISLVSIALPFNSEASSQKPHPYAPTGGGTAHTSEQRSIELDAPVKLTASMQIIENFDQGLMLTDARQEIIYVNPKFTEITGYSLAEAVGKTPRMLSSGRQSPEFYRQMWKTIQEQSFWTGQLWNRRKDGSLYLEVMNLRAIGDEQGRPIHYLATFSDLTRTQYGKHGDGGQIASSHIDPLTGLANRFLLFDRGGEAARSELAFAILVINLDRFSLINDQLGNAYGDDMLVMTAKRLREELPQAHIVARINGDEFVALLPAPADTETNHTTNAEAKPVTAAGETMQTAAALLYALSQPITIKGHALKVSASIGISLMPSHARAFDDGLVLAQRALTKAKKSGGGRCRCYAPPI